MERLDFNVFKKEVLVPYLKELEVYDTKKCLFVNYKALDKIYIHYQKLRNIIKGVYMKKGTLALDRHKVAACLIYGILRSKIIKVNKKIPELPPHLLMANEYFAINVAINVIEMYKRSDYNGHKGHKNYKLIIPNSYHECYNNNSAFLYNLCAGLYNQNIKHFDCIAYATIFFQLEHETDYILGIDDV